MKGGDVVAMIRREFVKGDLLTLLYAELQDGAGQAINLLGQDIKFYMVHCGTHVVKVNGKTADKEDAAAGKVSYSWEAADVDVVGNYWGWFVRVKEGKTGTHPIGEQFMISIVDMPTI
jgi:hypothetical protein